jgi:hypothetical protein
MFTDLSFYLKNMAVVTAVTLLLFTSAYGQSFNTQQAYLVTYQNDTIHGLIRDKADLSEKILFKSNQATNFKEYTPEDIKLFRFTGEYFYKAVQVPMDGQSTGKLFLLCLVDGRMSLYKQGNVFYVETDSLIRLEKKDVLVSTTQLKVDRRYVGLLSHLMGDCAALKNKIKRTPFEATQLIKLVAAYNTCTDPSEKLVVNSKAAATKLRLGVRGGAVSNTMDYFVEEGDYADYTFSTKTGYTAGVFFNLSFKDKISVQPEILLTRKSATASRTVTSTYQEFADFSFTYLQVPVSLYYTLPTKRIRPFASIGGVFGYALEKEANAYYLIKSLQTLSIKRPIEVDKDEYGYRGGVGILYSITPKLRLGAEYIYEKTLSNRTSTINKFSHTSHNLTLRMSL